MSLFDSGIEALVQSRKKENWYPNKDPNGGATGGKNVLTGYLPIKDKTERLYRTYPCHNPIRSFKNAECLWSAFGWRGKEETARRYHKWLLKESPWAQTGIVPTELDDQFMWNEGFVWVDLENTSANLLHNFLIASRMVAEWPKFIEAWDQLVTAHGLHPTFCFALLTLFQDVSAGTDGTKTAFREGSEGNTAVIDKYDWPLDMARSTEDYVRNFCSGKPVGKSDTMFFPTANTQPINLLWGKPVERGSVLFTKHGYTKIIDDLYLEELGSPRRDKVNSSFFIDPSNGTQSKAPSKTYKLDALVEILKREQKRIFR